MAAKRKRKWPVVVKDCVKGLDSEVVVNLLNPRVWVGMSRGASLFTPAQARRIAAALLSAADEAEAEHEK